MLNLPQQATYLAVLFALLLTACSNTKPDPATQFLSEAPYKKAKQAVKLQLLKTPEAIAIMRQAINAVVRLAMLATNSNAPASSIAEISTNAGATNWHLALTDKFGQPYIYQRIVITDVTQEKIEAQLSFQDLLKKQAPQKFRAIFLYLDGSWRFDHYDKVCDPD